MAVPFKLCDSAEIIHADCFDNGMFIQLSAMILILCNCTIVNVSAASGIRLADEYEAPHSSVK